jgi:hypothetical protein
MIVSASYRTDIPALYGEWFVRRLDAGFCRVANPWGGAASCVSLEARDVDGFVFWTKNLLPFFPRLAEVKARGIPFVVHYTITGYPGAIERAVPAASRAVAALHRLAERYGPRVAVWRYDPVLLTSLTSDEWHRQSFAKLARELSGTVDEVVVSFAYFYRKTERNLRRAARDCGFGFDDPSLVAKQALLAELRDLAGAAGMRLTLCAQPVLRIAGVEGAHCIDAARLSEVAGRAVAAPVKGKREGCLCHESRDIGDYHACTLGCVYCYAVSSRAAAKRRYARHDPRGEFLIPPAG